MDIYAVNSSFDTFIDLDEVNFEITSHLNALFGKDIKNLYKAKKLVEDLTIIQKTLEEKLLFATCEAPDKISKAIQDGEVVLEESKLLERDIEEVNKSMEKLQSKVQPLVDDIQPSVRIVQHFEKIQIYQKWIASMRELSEQIEVNLNSNNYEEALQFYQRLNETALSATRSYCQHFRKYAYEMVYYWHKILQSKLEREVKSVLDLMKYPFTSSRQMQLPVELVEKLQGLIDHLLSLIVNPLIHATTSDNEILSVKDLPINKRVPSLVTGFSVFLLPIQLLLEPLEVRFLYHFSGAKATNCRSNPEWYLTQVLKWIAHHESFLESSIQPVLDRNNQRVNAKVEFTRGLIRMVVIKLTADLPEIQSDEDLFCQTVQETLNFERELRLGLGYPATQPSVLNVLTQAPIFNCWILIERKFALELMDEFISRSGAWLSDDEIGVSQCGDQLILLLQGITDRYKPLPQPGHRLQFLDLQLELLDDFRVRVLQLTKSELSDLLKSNYCSILNTVHHIVSTLSDWSDLPFFIEIQYFKEKFNLLQDELKMTNAESELSEDFPEKLKNDVTFDMGMEDSFVSAVGIPILNVKQAALLTLNMEFSSPSGAQLIEVSGSVFQEISDLYSRIECEMMSLLTQHVLTEVRARSQTYRKDKWFVTPSENPTTISNILQISPSLCSFMEILVRNLNLLKENLSQKLFASLWKGLASHLDKFIYEDVILENNFSEYGGAQLQYDMHKALFPVFGEYQSKPENYFPYVRECLILLTLPRPTALLLKDALKYAKSERDVCSSEISPVKVLEERGVFTLNVLEADVILNIRTNMASL